MNKSVDELKEFIMCELWNSSYGGFYASINSSNADVITDDKLLLDLALGIIVYSELNDVNNVKMMIEKLKDYEDPDTIGYSEILDATDAVHPVGMVRTPKIQALVGYSMYKAGSILHIQSLIDDGISLIKHTYRMYRKLNYATIITKDWKTEIDDSISLGDVSLIVMILEKCNLGYLLDENTISLFHNFSDHTKGAFVQLDAQYNPREIYGKSLFDMSLFCLAILEIYKRNNETNWLQKIEETLEFIYDNLQNELFGGFWNQCDRNDKISMNPLNSYYNRNTSPFPYKSVMSEILLYAASIEFDKCKFNEKIKEIIKTVNHTINEYYDRKHCGFSLGKACWFSGPLAPSVPLARLAMVPQHTKGAFLVGNTGYVHLHQKQTTLQLVALLIMAKYDIKIEQEDVLMDQVSYKKQNYNNKLDYIVKGNLSYKGIDIKKYLEWSQKTRSGLGFGLTPYKAPLGFRSDKSMQNFSAMHVISDMYVLGEKIENKKGILDIMYACQNDDGGFGEQPSMVSEVFTTYCVVISAYLLNDDCYDKDKCINFLKSCQNTDGGFGNAPGYPSDSWHTNLAVMSLHLLGVKAYDEESLIQYLLRCRNEDGGYAIRPNGKSDTFSVFRAVDSLQLFEVEIPEKEKTVSWLQNMQDQTGGFAYREGGFISFVGSYHAIAALYILESRPKYLDECKDWLSKHQMNDGGFSRSFSGPSDTTDEGFIIIQALHMLENKLNPYWVRIVT